MTALPPGAGLLDKGDPDEGPKAYLNWVVFDSEWNLQEDKSGFVKLSSAPLEDGSNVAHERLTLPADLIISSAGYVYIWLSNEGEVPVQVYWDDFRVEHVKSPVVSSQDYYPFGLTFNSYSRENTTPNQYQYNGKEKQDELGLDWLDYGARMYLPEIGRWGVSDPKAESYEVISPYSYAFDNPIRFIDLQGQDPGDVVVVFDGADLSSLIPPGNGQKLVSQINTNGGSGKAFVGQFWETQLVDNPGGEYYSFRRLDMNSEDDMNMATQAAYNYIKENRKKDGRVVIYGYSWGGVLANHLAKRLQEDKIDVDYLVIVDAANGDKSDQVDRSVSENVKQVDNYYNPDPNSNALKSHGLPAKAKDESKTKVTNTVKITWDDGGKKKKVTHSNIDEATFNDVMKKINEFLNRK